MHLLSQASLGPDGKKKKKRSYHKFAPKASAEEALEHTLVQKKISKKINYEALAVSAQVALAISSLSPLSPRFPL
jgi:hypothetical protein